MPLLQHNPPLIDVDTTQIVDGKALVRLTEAGKSFLMPNPNTEVAAKPTYEVISNATLPESKRGNRKGAGAPAVYPFDSLEVGGTFFVPVSDKHPNPVKTLGSTVSSANMRFAVKTGEMKTVERTMRGPGNKAVKNGNGEKVKETVEVPVYKFQRKFAIRSVEKGQTYGSWTAPENGALIGRIQ
jgi:hypothetical protein